MARTGVIIMALLLLSVFPSYGGEPDLCDTFSTMMGDCYDGGLTQEDIEDAIMNGTLNSLTPEQAKNLGDMCREAGQGQLRGLTRDQITSLLGGLCRMRRDRSDERQGL